MIPSKGIGYKIGNLQSGYIIGFGSVRPEFEPHFPQNPGKLWDAKADGVLPLAGNWSKTGVDPIFDHNQKTL